MTKNKPTPITEMSKKELIKEYKAYFDMIHTTQCFGCRDLQYFYALEKEINNRGYTITTNVEVQ